jgi:hypothetical protein
MQRAVTTAYNMLAPRPRIVTTYCRSLSSFSALKRQLKADKKLKEKAEKQQFLHEAAPTTTTKPSHPLDDEDTIDPNVR